MPHHAAEDLVTIRDAARLLGVSLQTLRRWDREGRLTADHRGAGGKRLFRRSEVERRRTGQRAEADEAPTNIRPPPTSFVGRADELARLASAIDAARVVTLVGPPGVGKTRLAIQHALAARRNGMPAWFSDLSRATTLDHACLALERDLALAIAPQKTTDSRVEALVAALARRGPMHLVLDDVEQVLEPAARLVTRLERRAPETRVLLTSRAPLRIATEVVFEVAPMPVASDAVALFLARTQGYSGPDDSAIVEIVRCLGGVPLAIELAAARVGVLASRARLRWLGRILGALERGPSEAGDRRATLRRALDWSYDLLAPWEKSAFAQCSVFRGGFSIDAAEAVVDLSPFAAAPPVLDVLEALHEQSLLVSEDDAALGERRLSMFASIGQYARTKLDELELGRATRERHARFFLGRGRAWAEQCDGRGEARALRRLGAEEENLLAAQAHGAPEGAIEAIAVLEPLLWKRGCLDEHLAAVEGAVAVARRCELGPRWRVVALRARARARLRRDDPEGAERDLGEALGLARELDDAGLEASLLRIMSTARHRLQRRGAAVAAAEGALAIDAAACDLHAQGIDHLQLGALLLETGDPSARPHLLEAFAVLRQRGRPSLEALSRVYLGMLDHEHARLTDARRELLAASALLDRSLDPCRAGYALGCAASVLHEDGQVEQAVDEYERALRVLDDTPWPPYDAILRARLGAAWADLGELENAEAELDRAGRMTDGVDAWVARTLAQHRGHLDVARALRASADPATFAAHLRAARGQLAAEPDDPYETRLARRWLVAAIGRADGTSTDEVLLVGPAGRWFHAPGTGRIDLAHRKPLCRILSLLAQKRETDAGRGVATQELVACGWPGERMMATSGAKRVRVAIATLREFGLRGVLLRRADGYAIDPRVRVRMQ